MKQQMIRVSLLAMGLGVAGVAWAGGHGDGMMMEHDKGGMQMKDDMHDKKMMKEEKSMQMKDDMHDKKMMKEEKSMQMKDDMHGEGGM